jgi:hypothetical protein
MAYEEKGIEKEQKLGISINKQKRKEGEQKEKGTKQKEGTLCVL